MAKAPLRILHCIRSPVGGTFRHVRNLIEEQHADGHQVGVLLDSLTGGEFEDRLTAEIVPLTALGVHRVPMERAIRPSDIVNFYRTFQLIKRLRPDVLHGHGAKGAAYGRVSGTLMRLLGMRPVRLYTPHGGSLHYDPATTQGRIVFTLERILELFTDHLLFVSEYEAKAYRTKVGTPRIPSKIIHNGIAMSDFTNVVPVADPADFLYIGMVRHMKGPDLFIEALAEIARQTGYAPTACLVGDGEDREAMMALAERLVPGCVTFLDPMPAREAFALAKVVVVPSRFESLPYIVLEAIAAGRPIVATDVGGIGEIIPQKLQALVAPGDAGLLANAMDSRLARADFVDMRLIERVRSRFSIKLMADSTMAAYWRVLDARRGRPRLAANPIKVHESKDF